MEASRHRTQAKNKATTAVPRTAGLPPKEPGTVQFRTVDLSGKKRQAERIRQDEDMAARQREMKELQITTMLAGWSDTLDERSHAKRMKRYSDTKKEEMGLAAKELSALRKVQMQELYDRESEQYKEELEQLGTTFYRERI